MSLPPSKVILAGASRTAFRYRSDVGLVETRPTVVNDKRVCTSSGGVRRRIPFVYRGPTIFVDGNLRVEGETYLSDELSSEIVPIQKKSYPKRRHSWSVSGQVLDETGHWRKPRKKGQQIRFGRDLWRNPLPYSMQLLEGDISHFSGQNQYSSGPPSGSSPVFGYWLHVGDLLCSDYHLETPAFPPYEAGLVDRAVVKALGQLKDQDVNLAVAFGERKETAEMVMGSLRSLTKAAKAARKGNLLGAARALAGVGGGTRQREISKRALRAGFRSKNSLGKPKGQFLADNWLALQYGWMPAYKDSYGAVNALHKRDSDQPKRYSVACRAVVRSWSDSHSTASYNYGYGVTRDVHVEQLAVVRLDYYLENPLLHSLSQLGITNPVEVAWELVPFSFVWDWWNPIGGYVSSMDAALGFKFRSGSLTQCIHQQYRGALFSSNKTTSSWPDVALGVGIASTRGVKMDRVVYDTSPLPRAPSFKNPFPKTGRHIANAVSLFASSLRHSK